jgi:hypothetical protein
MVCAECERLRAQHGRLKAIWQVALAARKIGMATARGAEYRELATAVNDAWLDAACASLEFENHKKTHAAKNDTIKP